MVLPLNQPVKTIFFDLGFTLVNFEGDFYQAMSESYLALAESLIHSGCEFDVHEFTSRFESVISEYYRMREIDLIERPVEGYLLQVLEDYGCASLPDVVIQTALSAMYQVSEANAILEPDAYKTLENLRSSGYHLGLITNAANAANSNRLIDKFGIRHFFDVILISAEEKIRKPDTRIYTRALARMGAIPQTSVMVGDTLTADILGAQNAGMRGIWINRRARRPENEIESIKPDAVISSLDELLLILPGLK